MLQLLALLLLTNIDRAELIAKVDSTDATLAASEPQLLASQSVAPVIVDYELKLIATSKAQSRLIHRLVKQNASDEAVKAAWQAYLDTVTRLKDYAHVADQVLQDPNAH